MDQNVPYMPSVKNLSEILTAIQKAAVPESFTHEFLKDLGFTSSNDRAFIKLFRYLGMLDVSGKPQTHYREFVDGSKTKAVLAQRIRAAYDDLYNANPKAHEKTAEHLKGWFKTKTGAGDAVALKMASTLKAFASCADFAATHPLHKVEEKEKSSPEEKLVEEKPEIKTKIDLPSAQFGLVYRIEVHLPDTQNIDTFRAIFKAMREELMG